MLISVIIPTYKPQSYIRECLESIVAQTLDHSSFEVIISLNGCREPWLNELQEYINAHPDVCWHLIHTDTPGVSNARNIALDIATGEYVTFIDDDDYISPSYLEELLKNSSPTCVALTDSLYVDDATSDIIDNNTHHKRFFSLSSIPNPSLFKARVFFNGPCMKLIHRDIIGDRRFDTRFANGEDNLMMFLISNRIKHLKFTTSDAIYYRRIRQESATTRSRSRCSIARNSIKIMLQYTKYLLKNPRGYNYSFVLSRYIAEVKSILF